MNVQSSRMGIVPFALWILLLVVGVSLLLAVPTMLLWDWLMPTIFGLPEITLLQAVGINLLCQILFKPNARREQ